MRVLRPRQTLAMAALAAGLACAACGSGEEGEPRAEMDTAPVASVAYAGLTGDAERGRALFGQCRSCHAVEPDINRVGPSLHGVIGRRTGAVEDYNYTEANRTADVVWTEEALFAYLADPRAYIPGTKMSYAGLKDPQRRADLIAYLKTLS